MCMPIMCKALAQAQINDTLAVLFSRFHLIELQTSGLPSRESPEIYHVPAML